MLASRVFFILIILSSCFAMAGSAKTESLEFNFISWNEKLDLDDGIRTDKSFVDYFGNSIRYGNNKWLGSFGSLVQIAVGYGTATAGGTQTTIDFKASNIKWWNVEICAEKKLVLTEQIFLALGPELLYRNIDLSANGVSLRAGSDFNFGLRLSTHLRLNDFLELQQSISSLIPKTLTLWSLGLGYVF